MNITKRNGNIEKFDITKITKAMKKAFDSVERETNDAMLDIMALRTVAKAQEVVKELSVEVIQDCVEAVLMECGFSDVAKSYVLYRQKRANIRNMTLDVEKVVEEYIGQLDWRVKENSTVSYSLGGFILSNSGAITSNYWLNHFYDEEIANAHRNCDIHIHDLSMLSGYCAGWSLKQLILEGLGGVENRITSKPAKHLHTLCNQMFNFLGIMQNEWAGAQAFSSFDTYLSAFVKADNLDYHTVKQCIQSFVFGVNTPSRWGCVDTNTLVLTADGYKGYKDLKAGDRIWTFNKDNEFELQEVNAVVVKPYKGIMYLFKDKQGRTIQKLSPNHRMMIKQNDDFYMFAHAEKVAKGNFFGNFINMPCPVLDENKVPFMYVNKIYFIHDIEEVEYDDVIWCPNVENGTAIFFNTSENGGHFISGQCQAPFSNITLDWTCPEDLKDMPAIVGGQPQNFTYGDCDKERAMVNKAFLEVMIEGDANGRGHQYPRIMG